MRFYSYIWLSLLSMVSMVYYAYYTQKQFYPTVLFLVSSKLSFLVAGNMVLALALLTARFIKSIFFGSLREVEVEMLVERAKFTIIETSLALTIFRNELSPQIIALFGSLIFTKLLHKLSKYRLEYLEQIMPVSTFSQIRIGLLFATMLVVDGLSTYLSLNYIMKHGISVLFLFGFEFGLMWIYALNLSVRFVIQLVDARLPNGLASRGLYTMLSDLVCEIFKFITYVSFFCLIFVFYGIPIHIIRDVWAAYSSLYRKLRSFIKYIQLTRNLDSRFEDATAEELEASGGCLVCRDEMATGKKLPCGHVFHLDCLRTWLQHQQTCPLCRAEIPSSGSPRREAAVAAAAAAAARVQAEGAVEVPGAAQQAPNPAIPAIPAPAPAPAAATPRSAPDIGVRIGSPVAGAAGIEEIGGRAVVVDADAFPAFYLVATERKAVTVMSEPATSSQELRRIRSGTVVFITERAVGDDGSAWLRAPDGWILEVTSSASSSSPPSASTSNTSNPISASASSASTTAASDSAGATVRRNLIPLLETAMAGTGSGGGSGGSSAKKGFAATPSSSASKKITRKSSPRSPKASSSSSLASSAAALGGGSVGEGNESKIGDSSRGVYSRANFSSRLLSSSSSASASASSCGKGMDDVSENPSFNTKLPALGDESPRRDAYPPVSSSTAGFSFASPPPAAAAGGAALYVGTATGMSLDENSARETTFAATSERRETRIHVGAEDGGGSGGGGGGGLNGLSAEMLEAIVRLASSSLLSRSFSSPPQQQQQQQQQQGGSLQPSSELGLRMQQQHTERALLLLRDISQNFKEGLTAAASVAGAPMISLADGASHSASPAPVSVPRADRSSIICAGETRKGGERDVATERITNTATVATAVTTAAPQRTPSTQPAIDCTGDKGAEAELGLQATMQQITQSLVVLSQSVLSCQQAIESLAKENASQRMKQETKVGSADAASTVTTPQSRQSAAASSDEAGAAGEMKAGGAAHGTSDPAPAVSVKLEKAGSDS